MLERAGERERRLARKRAVVVGDEELARAPAPGQHVELDHLDAERERGVEARERVVGGERGRAAVADADQRWQPGHQ